MPPDSQSPHARHRGVRVGASLAIGGTATSTTSDTANRKRKQSAPGGPVPRTLSRRDRAALAGTLAVAAMLGAGKWGAHLQIGPVYLGDALLALALTSVVVDNAVLGRRPTTSAAQRTWPGFTLLAFLGWAAIIFVSGTQYDMLAFRDFAPYAYAFVAIVSASAFARSTWVNRARTVHIIEWALLFHLSWVLPARLIQGVVPSGGSGEELFALRFDTNGTVLGITACLFLMRFLKHGGLSRVAVFVLSTALVASTTSRAALIATGIGLLLTFAFYLYSAGGEARRKMGTLAALPLLLTLVAVTLPTTTAGSKLLVTVGLATPTNQIQAGGLGSADARSNAWQLVNEYTDEVAPMTGVGFGPNFMVNSGASLALIHSTDPAVRSPHNWFVGTYARLGAIGLALTIGLLVVLLRELWRSRKVAAQEELVFLAALMVPMTLAAATVGVVLEAPFGAIPFFWAAGILLSRPNSAGGLPTSTARTGQSQYAAPAVSGGR